MPSMFRSESSHASLVSFAIKSDIVCQTDHVLRHCLGCSAGVHNTSHVLLNLVNVPLNIMTKNHAMRHNCGDILILIANLSMYKKVEWRVCHHKYLNAQFGTGGSNSVFRQTHADTCHGQTLCEPPMT